jgi:PqqD family protein of HPr-rel-A system
MAKRVVTKELDSELMVYDPDLDAVHVLNATALLVYKLCSQGKKPAEIEHEMRQRFAIDQDEDVLRGIQECIAELREKGLLVASGD